MPPAATVADATQAQSGRTLKLHREGTFGEVSLLLLQPQSLANPSLAGTGTGLAINYLTSGVVALSARGDGAERMQPTRPKRGALLPQSAGATRQPSRGGARNRFDRESHELTAAQIANLKAAECHAGQIGLALNRAITIHWQAAGMPLDGMAKATGRFTDLLTKALARHGSRTAWLWTHENSGRNGGHCHLLAHVPADLVPVVTGLQRGWLRRITGQPYSAGVIHSRPVGGLLGLETGNPELHAVNLAVASGYLCKGAPQAVLDAFGIDRAHQPGGLVIGKRCGTSQNIGAKARKTWLGQ